MMHNGINYVAIVGEVEKEMFGVIWYVRLDAWSEDGRDTLALIECFDKVEAFNIAEAWDSADQKQIQVLLALLNAHRIDT